MRNTFFISLYLLIHISLGAEPPFDYVYDGKTTYCYHVNQPLTVTALDHNYILNKGMNQDCPVAIEITQTSTPPLYITDEGINYEFTATLQLKDNIFGLEELYGLREYNKTDTIPHANVHACRATTTCDIFTEKGNRYLSKQESSNFTNGFATFNQQVKFEKEGEYKAFAHVVLQSKDGESAYHMFANMMVGNIVSQSILSDEESHPNTSTGIIIIVAVVLVGLVVVSILWVMYSKPRKKKEDPIIDDPFSHMGLSVAGKSNRGGNVVWAVESNYEFKDNLPQPGMGYNGRVPLAPFDGMSAISDPIVMEPPMYGYDDDASQIDVGDSVSQCGEQEYHYELDQQPYAPKYFQQPQFYPPSHALYAEQGQSNYDEYGDAPLPSSISSEESLGFSYGETSNATSNSRRRKHDFDTSFNSDYQLSSRTKSGSMGSKRSDSRLNISSTSDGSTQPRTIFSTRSYGPESSSRDFFQSSRRPPVQHLRSYNDLDTRALTSSGEFMLTNGDPQHSMNYMLNNQMQMDMDDCSSIGRSLHSEDLRVDGDTERSTALYGDQEVLYETNSQRSRDQLQFDSHSSAQTIGSRSTNTSDNSFMSSNRSALYEF